VPLNSQQRSERQGNYPYYGASGVIDAVDGYLFDGDYVLVAEDGENLNSRKLPVAFLARGRFWVNNHAHIIKGKESVADDRFLIAWFAQADIKGYITGAAQPKLSQANLKRISLRVPPYAAQRKITSILSGYDDLIQNNTRRIAILEAMSLAIYREWFVEFRFPGHEKVKFVNSSLGKIPEGWRVDQLGNVSDLRWGDTNTTKAKYVEEGYTAYSAAGADGFLDYFDCDRNGVVLSAIGANCGGTWYAIGKWSCIKNTIRFWATHRSPSTEYLYFTTNTIEFWPRRGAAQPFISQQDARQKSIVVPSEDIETAFASIAKDLLLNISSLHRKSANLRKTRDLLLPKLISGQLDVEDLDIEINDAIPTTV
jgi:type I restriction enzyme, S subunit